MGSIKAFCSTINRTAPHVACCLWYWRLCVASHHLSCPSALLRQVRFRRKASMKVYMMTLFVFALFLILFLLFAFNLFLLVLRDADPTCKKHKSRMPYLSLIWDTMRVQTEQPTCSSMLSKTSQGVTDSVDLSGPTKLLHMRPSVKPFAKVCKWSFLSFFFFFFFFFSSSCWYFDGRLIEVSYTCTVCIDITCIHKNGG